MLGKVKVWPERATPHPPGHCGRTPGCLTTRDAWLVQGFLGALLRENTHTRTHTYAHTHAYTHTNFLLHSVSWHKPFFFSQFTLKSPAETLRPSDHCSQQWILCSLALVFILLFKLLGERWKKKEKDKGGWEKWKKGAEEKRNDMVKWYFYIYYVMLHFLFSIHCNLLYIYIFKYLLIVIWHVIIYNLL